MLHSTRYVLRDSIRHLALTGLSVAHDCLDFLPIGRRDQTVQIVNFHHVYEREEEDFRRVIAWLTESFSVVSYGEAVKRAKTGNVTAAYVAVTFDDGLKNHFTAANIMSEFGISACFFVCPAIVGITDLNRRREFCDAARMEYETTEFLSWDELCLMRDQGHEIGSHTMTHPYLAEISPNAVDEELGRSRDVLVSRLGCADHFAWPFGTFASVHRDTMMRASTAGYSTCASGVRGAHLPHNENDAVTCVRRDNMVPSWPLRHCRYFLMRNRYRAVTPGNSFPKQWITTATDANTKS